MAENALYSALDNYNTTIENKYKQNWGTLLNFLDVDDSNFLIAKMAAVTINPNKNGYDNEPLHSSRENQGNTSRSLRPASFNQTLAQRVSQQQREFTAKVSRNQSILMKEEVLQRYSHLMDKTDKSAYVYKSPRKQVVMMVPPHKKLANNFAYNTSNSFYRGNQQETQDSNNKYAHQQSYNSQNQYYSLSQGLNSNRQQIQESINSHQSEDVQMNFASPYQQQSLMGSKSLKQQLRSVKPRVQATRYTNTSGPNGQRRQQDPKQFYSYEREDNDKRIKGNHIQNSIKIMRQEERLNGGRSNINSFNTGNFDRIGKELHKTRMGFGIRNEREELNELMRSTDTNILRQSPEKQTQIKIRPNYEDERLRNLEKEPVDFHGQPANLFIANKQAEKWMSKRRPQGNGGIGNQSNRKHVEFAKNLFISWDDDGSGVLEAEEIIKPLIGLGLSNDSKFATKILQALDSRNIQDVKNKDDLRITLKDFIKIFKSDKVSEHLVNIINSEILQLKMQQQETQITKPPSQSIKHPDFKSPRNPQPMSEEDSKLNSGSSVMHNAKPRITLSMRTNDQKKIVEIPIDKLVDQISIHQKILDRSDGQQKFRTQVFKIKNGGQILSDPYENIISIKEEDNLRKQQPQSTPRMDLQRKEGKTSSFMHQLRGVSRETQGFSDALLGSGSKKKQASLQEQMEIIKSWWRQMDVQGTQPYEMATNVVCTFLVKKRIAQDKEQAAKIIFGQLGMATRKEVINFDEFNRIFCKGMFKEALINVTNSFDQMTLTKQSINDLPLSLKINEYQRNQMFSGLDPKSDNYKEGKQILSSLHEIKDNDSQTQQNLTYQKFLEDPLGHKNRQREEIEKAKKQVDPFVERIKFIENTEKSFQLRRPVVDNKANSKKNQKLTLLEAKSRYYEENKDKEVKFEEPKDINQRKINNSKEQVRIPAVYIEKTKEERLKDQNDLLTRFQRLLSMHPQINSQI